MTERYVMALDQGTTSSRAILFGHDGRAAGIAQHEFTQHYPHPGWVEHDGDEIWQSQRDVACKVLAETGTGADQIAAIGITNQRETTLIWDRRTGRPIRRAIVWQDHRTADRCDELKAREGRIEQVRERTGLIIDAYFSATKISWLLDHVEGARARAEAGELAFGTVDSWLVWNLTGGRCHVTDVTNASRTMLFNIHTLAWDEELLALFGVPPELLPEVRSSSEMYAETDPSLFGRPIPIAGIAGDQQAAAFGQRCTRPGMVKNTYGTGCFMLMHTGDKPITSHNNLLTTIACQRGERVEYALEGSIFIAGAVVKWLRDKWGIIDSSPAIEELAASVAGNEGVYLVPAFTGLGAPHWDAHASGMITGLSLGSTTGHIARAALEGIAYQVMDVLEAMKADSGIEIRELRVDGGASANDLLMQFQADIMRAPVVRPEQLETTALGAAYLAGLAVGFWQNQAEIDRQWQVERRFEVEMPVEQAEALRHGWQRALHATRAASNF
ncbi:MAG: glycerol kinase GlpK [Wenzhouxiangellaceae bacterium]|nr:glycerol kinase GlpK [Wenzhouxiangellaceae bacterium]